MHTKIFSAKIIHAINYLEFLNRKIIDHNALATPKTNQNQLFAANGKQETSTGAYKQGKLLENLYQTFKILTKTFFKVRIGIVENQLVAMLNPQQPKKKGSPTSL